MTSLTLAKGQVIHWPRAADGLAQVDDLRRTRVRLVYRTKRGSLRFATVRAASLACGQTVMPGVFNVLDRGVSPRSKTFQFPPPLEAAWLRTNTPTTSTGSARARSR